MPPIALQNPVLSGHLPVRSWKRQRDLEIVKQDKDFSCGAAALATLLNGFYGQSFSEADILRAMDKTDMRASFEDMQNALPSLGFKAQGFAASYEQLVKLNRPVLLYLQHRKNDHFSVLRGINATTVWLADPSLGNRTYSRAQFLAMWQTRDKALDHADLGGKFLAVWPLAKGEGQVPSQSAPITQSNSFFTKSPQRQTAMALKVVEMKAGQN